MDKRILFNLIILISLFHIVNISTYARLVNGPDTFPQPSSYINYDSEPYEVDEYNIQDVIEKARGLDYTIRFSTSCTDISANECEARGWLKETSEEGSSNKLLSVSTLILVGDDTKKFYNKSSITYIALHVSTNNYEFDAVPKERLKNPYIWWSRVSIQREGLSTDFIGEAIVNELKSLGIVSKNIKIEFGEGYVPSQVLLSEQNTKTENYSRSGILLFIIFVIILVIILIILLIKNKKRKLK